METMDDQTGSDAFVSPYLRRRLRTYEEFLRECSGREIETSNSKGSVLPRIPARRVRPDDGTTLDPAQDATAEGEARR